MDPGRKRVKPTEPYFIVAQDGADDDGGTLYVLYDGQRVITAASWPQPLEDIAFAVNRPVKRCTLRGGEPDNAD
jgi:hypothetical protein